MQDKAYANVGSTSTPEGQGDQGETPVPASAPPALDNNGESTLTQQQRDHHLEFDNAVMLPDDEDDGVAGGESMANAPHDDDDFEFPARFGEELERSDTSVPRSERNFKRKKAGGRIRLPLFVVFLPQLLLMLVIGIFSIVSFIGTYQDAARSSTRKWLAETATLIGDRTSEPFITAHRDLSHYADVVRATDAFLFDHLHSFTPTTNFTKFQSAFELAKAILFNSGNRYDSVIQSATHPLPYRSDFMAPVVPGETAPSTNAGCTHRFCAIPIANATHPTFDLSIFDLGWKSSYPSPIRPAVQTVVENYLRGVPSNFSGTAPRWRPIVGPSPETGELVIVFSHSIPLTWDANGFQTSSALISLDISTYLRRLVNATTIPMSEFAIVDLHTNSILQTSFASLAPGYIPAVRNTSVTDANVYLRNPSFFSLSGPEVASEPRLHNALAILNSSSNRQQLLAFSQPNPTSGAASNSSDTVIDLDSDDHDVITAKRLWIADGAKLMIVLITDKDVYLDEMNQVTFAVSLASGILIFFGVVVSVLTAVLLQTPIKEATEFVYQSSTLSFQDKQSTGSPTSDSPKDKPSEVLREQRSIFLELAELQDVSADMCAILKQLKGFVPHNVFMKVGTGSTNSMSSTTAVSISRSETNPLAGSPSILSDPPLSSVQELGPSSSRSAIKNKEHHQDRSGSAVSFADTTTENAEGASGSVEVHVRSTERANGNRLKTSTGSTSDSDTAPPPMPTFAAPLNVDRVFERSVNTFRPTTATMLFVSFVSLLDDPLGDIGVFGKECDTFFNATIQPILRANGVVEILRPGHVVATFDQGLHVDRATRCAMRICRQARRAGMKRIHCLVHTGPLFKGICGAFGRNAFIVDGTFMAQGMKILELNAQCLHSNVLVTGAVARSLPESMVALPVDRVEFSKAFSNAKPSANTAPLLLYEVYSASEIDTAKAAPIAKELFSFMLTNDFRKAMALIQQSKSVIRVSPSSRFPLKRLAHLCNELAQDWGECNPAPPYKRLYSGWCLVQEPDAMHDSETEFWSAKSAQNPRERRELANEGARRRRLLRQQRHIQMNPSVTVRASDRNTNPLSTVETIVSPNTATSSSSGSTPHSGVFAGIAFQDTPHNSTTNTSHAPRHQMLTEFEHQLQGSDTSSRNAPLPLATGATAESSRGDGSMTSHVAGSAGQPNSSDSEDESQVAQKALKEALASSATPQGGPATSGDPSSHGPAASNSNSNDNAIEAVEVDGLFSFAPVSSDDDNDDENRSSKQKRRGGGGSVSGTGLSQRQVATLKECEDRVLDLAAAPLRFKDFKNATWYRAPDAPVLGEGAFSKVYQGINCQGDIVALKCIDIKSKKVSEFNDNPEALLETELAVLTAIHHPNVANFISIAIHEARTVILLMEYVPGGTIRSFLDAYRHGSLLPRAATKRYAIDILHGLQHLHEQNVVHGDIKPENVLIGADSACKLSDFGSAVMRRFVDEEGDAGEEEDVPPAPQGSSMGMELRGTAPYMSPEAARGELPTKASDVWSFGVLLHEMIVGEKPWVHEPKVRRNNYRLMQGLAKKSTDAGAVRPRVVPLHPDDGNSEERQEIEVLLTSCFAEDPTKRPTVAQLISSKFFL